jgi:4-hydroxymandelate synthase
MTSSGAAALENALLDHVEFYVSDIAATTAWLVDGYGLEVYAQPAPASGAPVWSVGVGRNQIRFVLTEPVVADHSATAYIDRHGDGVANIALRVPDAEAAFDEAVRRGARPVSPPTRYGDMVLATIMGFGDVAHTMVQRPPGQDERELPGLRLVPPAAPSGTDTGLELVDHLAVCVEPGQIDDTVEFYRSVLDFDLIFAERIAIGSQAITTKVTQSRSGTVTLTLVEPDQAGASGHVDEFLKNHGCAGVQHIAFTTRHIADAVADIGERGIEFLSTPASYYDMLAERLRLSRYSVEQLHELNILVDEDHDGQLFQIFAKSTHPRNTFFFELIERAGARSFGSGNIKALYEAVELQRGRG